MLIIGDSLVLGGWALEVARETHALPFCHSARPESLRGQNNPRPSAKFTLRSIVHPPQCCYGGRVCGSNLVFKIKNLLQKTKTSSSSPIKPNQGFIDEKNSEFFSGHFYRKSLANLQKMPQKHVNLSQKTCNL